MSNTVTGVIEAKTKGKTKRGTYGILVNDKWYNSKYPVAAEKGSEVTFEVAEGGYISNLKVAQNGSQAVSGGVSRGTKGISRDAETQRHIIRQNALAHATAIVVPTIGKTAKDSQLRDAASLITDLAAIFEAWVYTGGRVEQQETNQEPPEADEPF